MLRSSVSTRLRLTFRFLLRPSSSPFSTVISPAIDADVSVPSPPTQESILYVLKQLEKKPQNALSFFRCATSQYTFVPGPAAYNLMLRILGSPSSFKDHAADFWSFLGSMDEAGHAVDRGTYATLITTFKKNKLPSESAALAQFYSRAAQRATSDEAVASALNIVRDATEEWSEETEKKLQEAKVKLSEIEVAKVIRELRDRPMRGLVFFRWAGRQPGYKHGSVAYNGMLRGLSQESVIAEFWNMTQEMKSEGHEVDVDTYVKVLRQFIKSKMMKEAVRLYELMMDGPYKPAIQDCGILLRQIALTGTPDLDLVFRVVKKYEAAGYSLSKVVYDGIHRSLTSVGKFEDAEEIMKRMRIEGHEPDNITYSQLVFGLCKANMLDDARKILDEMEAGGCAPDIKTWTVLIQGHCKAGKVDKALELLTEMIEKNFEADADVLEILVKGLCSNNRAEDAYTLIAEMVEKTQLRPWQATYKLLIQELLKAGKLDHALKSLRMMKSHKFPPFAEPFPPHIAKHGTTDDAREFLKALTVNNYPSHTAYLHVFKSFFKESRYSEAQDLLFKCPHHIRKHVDITNLFDSVKTG